MRNRTRAPLSAAVFMLAVSAVVGGGTVGARAQDSEGSIDAAKAIDSMAETRRARAALSAHVFPPSEQRDDAWYRTGHVAWDRTQAELIARFSDAFGRSDWDLWTLPEDEGVLRSGLVYYYRRSLKLRRFDEARRVVDACISRFPGGQLAIRARHTFLPEVLMCSGDVQAAIAVRIDLSASLEGHAKAVNELSLGDLRSVTGDFRGATAAYAKSKKAMAAWGREETASGHTNEFSVRFAAESMAAEFAIRKTLWRKRTAKLHARDWVGAPTIDWAHLRGKVIVIWVCPEMSDYVDKELRVLERFARANAKRPVQVLVVVRPSTFPKSDTLQRNGVRNRIAEFRESRALSVPFALLDDEKFTKLFGELSSTVRLVATHEGKIVHASVFSPGDPACLGLAQYLVDRLVEPDDTGDASAR